MYFFKFHNFKVRLNLCNLGNTQQVLDVWMCAGSNKNKNANFFLYKNVYSIKTHINIVFIQVYYNC